MREIHVNELKPGDVVSKTLFGKTGIVMLEAGTTLTDAYIARLKGLGYAWVPIGNRPHDDAVAMPGRSRPGAEEDGLRDSASIERMKNDEAARKKAEEAVRRFAESDRAFGRLALPAREAARFRRDFRDRVLQAIEPRPIAEELSVLMQTDSQLFGHSLQVSLLANVAGEHSGYDASALHELTVGSLLFDIGMTRLPDSLLKSKRKLTDAEREAVRQHPRLGYKALSAIREVPPAAARCALLHHERYNGGGYPLAFKGEAIPELAQLIGLADVYDALLSERHHREAYPDFEAMEYLFAAGQSDFGMEVIRLFLKHIAVYPVSSVVELSSGQLGVVENVDDRLAHRPVVRIIREADGRTPELPYAADLNLDRKLVIVKKIPLAEGPAPSF